MGDPMSMRDFEDDEMTTSNWDIGGFFPCRNWIFEKTLEFDEGKWTDMIRNVGFFLQTLSLEAPFILKGFFQDEEKNVDT